MRWFYASKADGSKHGLVEKNILFDMAKKGELQPTDLVWEEGSEEGWVLASSVTGLFAGQKKKKKEKRPQKNPSATPATAPPPAAAPRQRKPLNKVVVVLGVLAGLMACAVLATVVFEIHRKNQMPPEPPVTGPPPEVVRSNRVVAISHQIDALIEREDLGRAQTLWAEMKKNDDGGTVAETYRQRINALQLELQHFMQLQALVRHGKLTTNNIAEVIRVYKKRGGNKELVALADAILADKAKQTPALSLSMARLYRAVEEHDRLKKSLNLFSSLAPTNGPPTAHLEIADMYGAENLPTNGMRLLEKYLAGEKTNSVAWLELGAIRCATGHEDEAMDALKKAVEYGGNDARRAAVAEPRFKPISDKWSFGRLTKLRD